MIFDTAGRRQQHDMGGPTWPVWRLPRCVGSSAPVEVSVGMETTALRTSGVRRRCVMPRLATPATKDGTNAVS